MLFVCLQVGARFEFFIVEIEIQVQRLQVSEREDCGDGAGKFAETAEDVFGLYGDEFPEFFAVDLGGAANFARIFLRSGG